MATTERPIFVESGMRVAKPKTPVRKFVDFLGANPLTRCVIRGISPFLIDTGTEAINFNLTSLDQLQEFWKPNALILIVANHQSHADHLAMLTVTRKIRQGIPKLKTVFAPISVTLENGIQSGISQTIYHQLALPTFEQNNISPIYVVTPNDRAKRGIIQTREEAIAETEQIKDAVKKDYSGMFVLAEGTVQPGRHKKDGSIYGMIKVVGPFFRVVIEAARESSRDVICIPVGVDKTHRILSAEHIFLTRDSFMAIVRRFLRKKVMNLAEVTVGSPFIIGPQVNPRELNDSIMRDHIAPLIPMEARGVHKDNYESTSN